VADTQIAALASSPVPKVYTLPSGVEFTLKAVNASLDGSGAASSFLPCVTILSDSGHVIVRAVDTAVSVAAGGTAEVSWFPGVKHAGAASLSLDWSSPQQVVPILELGEAAAGPFTGFATLVPDNACFYGGYLRNTPVQGDAIAVRFGLAPQGSVWGFSMMHTTGPDHGRAQIYLGRLPDDDPFANPAEPDPTNLLGEIDNVNGDFTYILGGVFDCYSAAFTRNVVTLFGFSQATPGASSGFRITGEPGSPMTAGGTDPDLSLFTTGDGGPGVYAMKIVMGDKRAASTGYRLGIQSLAATRHDALWA
jgi:hypothetical protein